MTEMRCEELAPIDAEVALGIADARTRAAALAHAERCPACRRRLAALADVSAALVELAPPAQPPAGFESRVLARVLPAPAPPPAAAAVRRRRARARRWLAAAAAAVALAVLAGAGGWWIGRPAAQQPGPPTGVVTAALTGAQVTGGQVVLVPGPDPWLSMTLHATTGGGLLRCQVVEAGGRPVTVGWFRAVDGYAYWAAPVPPTSAVRGVRVVDAGGAVIATASFRPGDR